MARRRYQEGRVFLRSKTRMVWVGRWREDIVQQDGTVGTLLYPEQGYIESASAILDKAPEGLGSLTMPEEAKQFADARTIIADLERVVANEKENGNEAS